MAQTVVAANLLTAGLRSDFWDTYEKMYAGLKGSLGDVMQLDVPSDKLKEIYGYFLSAPYPRRWERGEHITQKPFKSVQFSLTNKDYGIRVNWHINDRMDDQTKSLRDRAADAGKNFATLDERIFFQLLTGATDNDLLRNATPNAPDGAALFSATDGDGADRFGVSGGNIVTGGGVASGHAIRVDLFKAAARFRAELDTEGQPLLDDGVIENGLVVYYNVNNWQVFAEAFEQARTVGAIGATTAAAPTNVIMDAGLKIELRPTVRITDNDWFVFLKGMRRKAIFKQVRQPIQEYFATMENSDWCRSTKEEYAQWDMRAGYGVMLPYAAVKVNN